MSEKERSTLKEQEVHEEAAQEPEEKEVKTEEPKAFDPIEAMEKVASGRMALKKPIEDGDKKYDELKYDFEAMTGWEMARAIDQAGDRGGNAGALTDTQALFLFAAAAAKATGGLDAKDIRERMGISDAIAAISVASIFFRGTLLAGSLRITKA